MNHSEEETVAALRLLFVKITELSSMKVRDLLLPGKYREYKTALDIAYDSLVMVEDALDSLGMKLENQHWRIESAVEEIKPLSLNQTSSREDQVSETVEQIMQRWEHNTNSNL